MCIHNAIILISPCISAFGVYGDRIQFNYRERAHRYCHNAKPVSFVQYTPLFHTFHSFFAVFWLSRFLCFFIILFFLLLLLLLLCACHSFKIQWLVYMSAQMLYILRANRIDLHFTRLINDVDGIVFVAKWVAVANAFVRRAHQL